MEKRPGGSNMLCNVVDKLQYQPIADSTGYSSAAKARSRMKLPII